MLKVLPAAVGFLLLAACAPLNTLLPGTSGNPANDAYAGSPGSVYDTSANPPRALGVVTYDPNKGRPIPAGETTPPAPQAMSTPAH